MFENLVKTVIKRKSKLKLLVDFTHISIEEDNTKRSSISTFSAGEPKYKIKRTLKKHKVLSKRNKNPLF